MDDSGKYFRGRLYRCNKHYVVSFTTDASENTRRDKAQAKFL